MPRGDKEKIKAYQKQYYQENKDRYIVYNRNKRAADPIRNRLYDIKSRCRKVGIEFDLKEEDIVMPDVCPVLGIKLEKGSGSIQNASPSFDRIDPSKGYVKGNIQILSVKANAMKRDATPEELRMFARWVLKTFPEEPDAQT